MLEIPCIKYKKALVDLVQKHRLILFNQIV